VLFSILAYPYAFASKSIHFHTQALRFFTFCPKIFSNYGEIPPTFSAFTKAMPPPPAKSAKKQAVSALETAPAYKKSTPPAWSLPFIARCKSRIPLRKSGRPHPQRA
jgi:hypothetical protein